jgi:outer membrane protein assembly factor BamD
MTFTAGLPRLLLLSLLALLLAACGRFGKDDPLETLPVEALYAEAKESLENGNLPKAERYYKRLIARFPFGPYTEQSQIELAYVYYRNRSPRKPPRRSAASSAPTRPTRASSTPTTCAA